MADQISEATPLLNPDNNPTNGDETPSEILPASAHFRTATKILTMILLASSVLCFLTLLAIYISIKVSPALDGYAWRPVEFTQPLGLFSVIVFVFAVLNYLIWIPIGINILVDSFLAVVIFMAGPGSMDYLMPNSSWCHDTDWEGKPRPVKPGCDDVAHRVGILMIVATVFAIIIGVSHSILFVLRLVAAFRSQFWRRSMPLGFPTGQLTFEFTIKLLRQERSERQAENTRVGASTQSGEGEQV